MLLAVAPWTKRGECAGSNVNQTQGNGSITSPTPFTQIAIKHASKWVLRSLNQMKRIALSAAKSWKNTLEGAYRLITSNWMVIAGLLLTAQALKVRPVHISRCTRYSIHTVCSASRASPAHARGKSPSIVTTATPLSRSTMSSAAVRMCPCEQMFHGAAFYGIPWNKAVKTSARLTSTTLSPLSILGRALLRF